MNSLFKSIYDDVITNTNRPNLRAETTKAVKEATKELHNRAHFVRDIAESILTSTNGGVTHYMFSLPSEVPIRKIVNVTPLHSSGLKGAPLEEIDLFAPDLFGNWYKWNNSQIQIHVAHPAQMFALSYLTFPKLDEMNYDSWIAMNNSNYISDLATFKVLKDIGKLDQAGVYRGLVGSPTIPGSHVANLLLDNAAID